MEHEIKCWPEHYAAIDSGAKTCELRLADRPYQRGDSLLLREYEPVEVAYTGREMRVRVTHVLAGGPWLAPGYVALSIRPMGEDGRARVQEDFRKAYDEQRERADNLGRDLSAAHRLAEKRVVALGDELERARASIGDLQKVAAAWRKRADENSARELEAVQELARAVVTSMSRPLGYTDDVTLVDSAALRKLEQALTVSLPSQAENEPAQSEETQAAPFGLCPRCGQPLHNLYRGISVIAGGVSVCTTCLNPGETELARARGLFTAPLTRAGEAAG